MGKCLAYYENKHIEIFFDFDDCSIDKAAYLLSWIVKLGYIY